MNVKVYGLGLREQIPATLEARQKKMKQIEQNCIDLGIAVPSEVQEYLDHLREVDLTNVFNYYGEYRQDQGVQEQGIEITLRDLPKSVDIIRVVLC